MITITKTKTNLNYFLGRIVNFYTNHGKFW